MADKSLTPIDLPELSSAPASPASGFHRFYAKTDGKAYSKSSAGTEYDLTTGVSLTTTGTSGAATLVGSTLNIPQYQSVLTNPVTGTGTSGQIAYWNGTTTQAGSNNLFWDAANNRLGIGTTFMTYKDTNTSPDSPSVLSIASFSGKFQMVDGGVTSQSWNFVQTNSALNRIRYAFLNALMSNATAGSEEGNLRFFTKPSNGVAVENLRIDSFGRTLIGNTDGTGRLTVRGSGTTSATTALLVQNSTPTANFTIRDDGGYAFRNGTVGLAQTGYTTFTNLTTDRTCNANATTVEELADILGTLIEDLKTKGIIAA